MYFTSSKPLGGKHKLRYWDFVVKEKFFENGGERVADLVDFSKPQEYYYDIPEKTAPYLYFQMQKINTDLQNVIKGLALKLRIGKSRISFAGLKDKRGVTVQRMCIFEPDVELLKQFNWQMVRLHSFRWQEEKLQIGDLIGNCFEIIIRNIDEEKDIENIVNNFAKELESGLPNKFGEQRFGGIRYITHKVGKLLIEQKTKDAVMLYLTYISEKEPEDVKEARKLISDGEYVKALKKFPKKGYRYEKAILHSLVKNPNDYVNAWLQLPKNITYLFTHAYQSYLFNKYLDLRLKEFGKAALEKKEGDIVENNKVMGPLFGYEFEFAEGHIGELEKKVLEEEGLKLEDFKVKNFPQMSVSGSRREIKLDVKYFKLLEVGKDEFNENKQFAKISFCLPKGSYATVLLDELMKPLM